MAQDQPFRPPVENGKRACRRCGRLLPFEHFECPGGPIVTLDGKRHSLYCDECRSKTKEEAS